jgi:EAL domain-containing protein (putative c-di-GMP-specific phosphodiesterase class I)/DNA-binding NarL/FixJ family response regulator
MTGRSRILVADDDPAVRSLLEHALEREDFEVVLTSNGVEAVEAIKREDFAVMLLDVQMPVMDGLEALREIRADDRSRSLPIILITVEGALSERVLGLESGADDYLVKPFAIEEVLARVRAQIRGRVAWERELDRGRKHRRRLAAAIEELPRDETLVAMATSLVDRLPKVLDLDGAAILYFSHGAVRTIASSGGLRTSHAAMRVLAHGVGRQVEARAASGPWLVAASGRADPAAEPIDMAYVPFRLGATPAPLGCLVFSLRPGQGVDPLSHRLPDLIDATEFIVAVLRPAVELAENEDVAITRIQRIIARHEYAVSLQPIVDLTTGRVMAVEALTRFADGKRPDHHFAEAASLGLSSTLQRATLDAAIQAAVSLPAHVALSVNLSADVLQQEPTIPKIVAGISRPLIIEITEHERIDDYDAVRAALLRLGPGVKLAIDDAGSGYSSLRHILALQPAYVKLDIEWVHDIHRDPVRRALVSGLAYFAAETGCELIAEGIETEAELKAIRELGIHLGQGYLLGRPAPAGSEG